MSFKLPIVMSSQKRKIHFIFKSSFKHDYLIKEQNSKIKSSFFIKNSVKSELSLLKIFLKINTIFPYTDLVIHSSFITYFYNASHQRMGVFNIKKFFAVWQTLLIILTNVFFYKLRYIAFSNSYFKYEVLALN